MSTPSKDDLSLNWTFGFNKDTINAVHHLGQDRHTLAYVSGQTLYVSSLTVFFFQTSNSLTDNTTESSTTTQIVNKHFYKDMFNPNTAERAEMQSLGRPKQDAFLLLILALEARARALGRIPEPEAVWRARNMRLLGAVGRAAAEALRP